MWDLGSFPFFPILGASKTIQTVQRKCQRKVSTPDSLVTIAVTCYKVDLLWYSTKFTSLFSCNFTIFLNFFMQFISLFHASKGTTVIITRMRKMLKISQHFQLLQKRWTLPNRNLVKLTKKCSLYHIKSTSFTISFHAIQVTQGC